MVLFKLLLTNKGLDAINIGNILYHISVKYKKKNPPYCKDQYVLIISYIYITPIANKIFYY